MAKSELRIQAKKMREQGESVKDIAQKLGVSKSTASMWVRDVILSIEQLEKLKNKMFKGAERGRILGALHQKEARLKKQEDARRIGFETLYPLSNKELLIAGIALYWGEGCKKGRRVSFCNSDPHLIIFMISWLIKCLHIPISEMYCYVGIHESHRDREKEVIKYWSNLTGIPETKFLKTSFKKVQNKKIYEHREEHFGTLTVNVREPRKYYYSVMGYIEGLAKTQMPG